MDESPDSVITSDLGHKLIVALRSVSDPQALMQAIADRSSINLKNELTIRIDAMDRATNLWHEDLVRIPTDVQKATTSLREFIEQYIQAISNELKGKITELEDRIDRVMVIIDRRPYETQAELIHLKDLLTAEASRLEQVADQRFLRIDAGLMERDKRADQLALANSAALAAALAAQKEAAGEAQKSSALAISKSESATTESIKQGQTLNQTGLNSLILQVNDLKSRLDKGEGGRTISDPATAAALASLSTQMSVLASSSDRSGGAHQQKESSNSNIIAIIAVIAAVLLVAVDTAAIFYVKGVEVPATIINK